MESQDLARIPPLNLSSLLYETRCNFSLTCFHLLDLGDATFISEKLNILHCKVQAHLRCGGKNLISPSFPFNIDQRYVLRSESDLSNDTLNTF